MSTEGRFVLTPEERSLRAKLTAHRLHAVRDPKTTTAKGRAAFLARIEKVDPEGILSKKERHRRAEHARKAHFAKLALQSARADREQRERGHKLKIRREEYSPSEPKDHEDE
jgi:hypothetical protein